MNFLALVIALAWQQALDGSSALQRDSWFDDWLGWIRDRDVLPGWLPLIAVGVPLALALLVLDLVGGWFFGAVGFVLSVLMLVYALGREDYHGLLARVKAHCSAGDLEAAWLEVTTRLSVAARPGVDPGSAGEARDGLREALVYEGYQRWYGPLFYFAIAGPVGALAYRLLQLLRQQPAGVSAERILYWVDWLPTRLLILTFAVTGDFRAAQGAMAATAAEGAADTERLLARGAVVALGRDTLVEVADDALNAAHGFTGELAELESLFTRSAGAWLLLLALFVIIS